MSGEPTLHRVQSGDKVESKKVLMFADGTDGGLRKSDDEHESQRSLSGSLGCRARG
jgi:hypothetical protein